MKSLGFTLLTFKKRIRFQLNVRQESQRKWENLQERINKGYEAFPALWYLPFQKLDKKKITSLSYPFGNDCVITRKIKVTHVKGLGTYSSFFFPEILCSETVLVRILYQCQFCYQCQPILIICVWILAHVAVPISKSFFIS